jgi:hypothetical protein
VTAERAAGALLIFLPLAFNAFFFLLGRRFDYPDILRRPTEDILSRFQAGGVGLKLLWYGLHADGRPARADCRTPGTGARS